MDHQVTYENGPYVSVDPTVFRQFVCVLPMVVDSLPTKNNYIISHHFFPGPISHSLPIFKMLCISFPMLQEPTLVRVIVQTCAVHGSRILLPAWWQWRMLERLETLLVVVTPEKKK